jgi:chemotaxis protein MotB
MKDKPSEWIAISDLMAGVMAVVMLLLILAVLQRSASELRYQQELEKANSRQPVSIERIMQALDDMLRRTRSANLMSLDTGTRRLTLRDGVFERGSACLTAEVRTAVQAVQQELARFLRENPKARILVEGYTDNLPVKQPVLDVKRYCTVYDDNFTLSAARAREARKALIGLADPETARRVVVAGYGDSRPLEGVDPADPRNRRVEVQFILEIEQPRATP